MENSVICSELCSRTRLRIHELIDKYFPTNGCDNCWGDLHQGCSEQCRREFVEGSKFARDLWELVRLSKSVPATPKELLT